MSSKKGTVRAIENIVKDYYRSLGYKILKTNYKCKKGKIDIIAKDMVTNELVFTEIKSSYYCNKKNYNCECRFNIEKNQKYQNSQKNKQKTIVSATKYYTYKYNLLNSYIRFDLVEINMRDRIYLKHFKNCEFERL